MKPWCVAKRSAQARTRRSPGCPGASTGDSAQPWQGAACSRTHHSRPGSCGKGVFTFLLACVTRGRGAAGPGRGSVTPAPHPGQPPAPHALPTPRRSCRPREPRGPGGTWPQGSQQGSRMGYRLLGVQPLAGGLLGRKGAGTSLCLSPLPMPPGTQRVLVGHSRVQPTPLLFHAPAPRSTFW